MASTLRHWQIYVKERFPLLTYALLSGGFAASSASLGGRGPTWRSLAVFIGVILFFFTLRLMDELKDYDKDVIAHPERPLPRGVLSREHVATAVRGLVACMLVYAAVMQSLAYFLVTTWLWLMYKEFYVGPWLAASPFLYAITHQVILLPLAVFGVDQRSTAVDGYALGVLGAFFTYEICSKLDPKAHPVLKTYVSVYGRPRTFGLVVFTTSIAALGAYRLGLPWLGAIQIFTPLAFLRLLRHPNAHKPVELCATLGLLICLYAGVIAAFMA